MAVQRKTYKKTYKKTRTKRRRVGGSWLGDAFTKAHDFVKKNKLVSTIANALGSAGVPYASAIGKASAALGYGKRVHRRRRGGDVKGIFKTVHKFVKDNRLVSKGLRTFLPNSNLHKSAHALGYGLKKPVRRYAGGANFFTTEQIAVPRF